MYFTFQGFIKIYKQFFPQGDPSKFASLVFRVFDENNVRSNFYIFLCIDSSNMYVSEFAYKIIAIFFTFWITFPHPWQVLLLLLPRYLSLFYENIYSQSYFLRNSQTLSWVLQRFFPLLRWKYGKSQNVVLLEVLRIQFFNVIAKLRLFIFVCIKFGLPFKCNKTVREKICSQHDTLIWS